MCSVLVDDFKMTVNVHLPPLEGGNGSPFKDDVGQIVSHKDANVTTLRVNSELRSEQRSFHGMAKPLSGAFTTATQSGLGELSDSPWLWVRSRVSYPMSIFLNYGQIHEKIDRTNPQKD